MASVITTEFSLNFGHNLVSTVTGLRKIGLFEGSFFTTEEGLWVYLFLTSCYLLTYLLAYLLTYLLLGAESFLRS